MWNFILGQAVFKAFYDKFHFEGTDILVRYAGDWGIFFCVQAKFGLLALISLYEAM